ncbi:hypothetical protein OG889_32740 [Streptomyces sp. NBC_00481]|uniref:hypothetical protein n=1 Tax=Streptomyces sp. NBC_00481 TaxID=2975755 RepID=UPI002DDB66E9|nr:hypothetical protein [Streptomyces sp. NBC_00481]WRY99041.1 hypothetical protein OG889_32740 [Streptomyces sp. NBC_00481]
MTGIDETPEQAAARRSVDRAFPIVAAFLATFESGRTSDHQDYQETDADMTTEQGGKGPLTSADAGAPSPVDSGPRCHSGDESASPDVDLMRGDAPQVSALWKLADRFRAGADRIDGLAFAVRWLRAERRLWRLADRVRAGADRIDDLAFDVRPEGRLAW